MARIKTSKVKVKKSSHNKLVKLEVKRLSKKSTRPSKARRIFKRPERGVVYVSHLPHGFYEDQLQSYFNQFGKITNVAVPRSKGGKSKGYAFVEFEHPEVGKIAAETMNNYLMFHRVVKAKYLEPVEQKPKAFKRAKEDLENHNTLKDKALRKVEANKEQRNRQLQTTEEAKLVYKLMRKCRAHQKQAQAHGGENAEVEINAGSADAILKHNKEILKAHKKAKEEAEKKRLQQEAEEKAAREAAEEAAKKAKEVAEKALAQIKREKKAGKKRRLRALKILKSENPNYTKEELEEKLKNMQQIAEKKKLKNDMKKKAVENQLSEDKKQDTDGSTERQTKAQVKKNKRKALKPENSGNHINDSVESKAQSAGILSKKIKQKKQQQKQKEIKVKEKHAPLILQHTLNVINTDLLQMKKDQPQALAIERKKKNLIVEQLKPTQSVTLSLPTTRKQIINKIKKNKLLSNQEQVGKIASKKGNEHKKPSADSVTTTDPSPAEEHTAISKKRRHRNRSSSETPAAKSPKTQRNNSALREEPTEAPLKSPRKQRHRNRSSSENPAAKSPKTQRNNSTLREEPTEAPLKSPRKQRQRSRKSKPE